MRKTAVVGGATGGIGEAVVAALVAADYHVFALGRAADKLAAMQRDAVVPCAVGLARLDALPEPLAGLERLDALVHCAGIAEVGSVEDTPRGVWDETFSVNVSGPAALTRGTGRRTRQARLPCASLPTPCARGADAGIARDLDLPRRRPHGASTQGP